MQNNEEKQIAKLQQAQKAEIVRLQQQHASVTKKRDQQIKALFDSKNILQKKLDQADVDLKQVTNQYLAAAKEATIAGWIREIEDDSGDTVRPLHETACLMSTIRADLRIIMHACSNCLLKFLAKIA